MDFRFNFDKLFGDNDVLVNDEATCAIEKSNGLVGGVGKDLISYSTFHYSRKITFT